MFDSVSDRFYVLPVEALMLRDYPWKCASDRNCGVGHEIHFTVARWGHDNFITTDNPRNNAGGDEYWGF